MNHSDKTTETDGGNASKQQTQSAFDVVADVEYSRAKQYRDILNGWIFAPAKIIWSDWRARVGMMITVFFVLVGTVGVRIVDMPYAGDSDRLIGAFETMEYPLGTDGLGRGVLAQLVHATPAMLEMIAAGAVFGTVLAVVWGVYSGYKGGAADRMMMSIADVLMTIPGLPLVVVLAAVLEPSEPWMIGVILVVNAWAGLARSLRSEVLKLRRESYVEVSRTMGISTPAILTKDILPNIMPLVVVNFVTMARNIIMWSVGLYFLGFLPHTGFNWGVMLNDAYGQGGVYLTSVFHWFYSPMITIVLLSLGLLLLGQGLDRIFNPRIRARHTSTTHDGEDEPDTDDRSTFKNQQGGL